MTEHDPVHAERDLQSRPARSRCARSWTASAASTPPCSPALAPTTPSLSTTTARARFHRRHRHRDRQRRRPRRHRPPDAIERLQFADQSSHLVPGLNADPVGSLTILDADTNTPDDTPIDRSAAARVDRRRDRCRQSRQRRDHRVGVLHLAGRARCRAPASSKTSSCCRPAISHSRAPTARPSGSRRTSPACRCASRPSTRTPMACRDRVLGADRAGRRRARRAADRRRRRWSKPPRAATASISSRSDLEFILDQIKIAEAHAAGAEPAVAAAERARAARPAHGRRIVQQPGQLGGIDQTEFGAADNIFPRLTDPVFRDAEDGAGSSARHPASDVILPADQRHRVRLAAAHHLQPDRRPDRQQPGGRMRRL